jgi:hypothetical protein
MNEIFGPVTPPCDWRTGIQPSPFYQTKKCIKWHREIDGTISDEKIYKNKIKARIHLYDAEQAF